jgi:bifunctional non-homologous end joining protein LigD
MPALLPPMLATLAQGLPANAADYAYEYKWDGVRAIARWDGAAFSLQSRNQLDITARYPELWALADVFGSRMVMLDGEIVSASGKFQDRDGPFFYYVFDVLWLDGKALTELPWIERRDRLEQLELNGPAWLVSPAHVGKGREVLSSAQDMKLEGVVAKKLDGAYHPGQRSPDWLKVKIVSEDEFVVGGWVPENGDRTSRVGSLLVGAYDAQGRLRFKGGVGTGFDDEDHARLTRTLKSLKQSTSPFADVVPKRGAAYVRPEMVVQIEYRRIGPEGILQQAAFKGIRTDKPAREVG